MTTTRPNPLTYSTVQRVILRTVSGIEYVDVFFRDGRKLNLKGPRGGMKVDKYIAQGVLRVNVEFHGFEVVE